MEQKALKTGFLTSASISLSYTQYGPKINVQLSHDITPNVFHPHDPTQMTHRPSQPSMTKNDRKWLINKFFQHLHQ
jgi:hypothetical protein